MFLKLKPFGPACATIVGSAFILIALGCSAGTQIKQVGQNQQYKILEAGIRDFSSEFDSSHGIEKLINILHKEKYSLEQPCGDTCRRTYTVSGDQGAPYIARLIQFSTRLNSVNYHYDRPFDAELAVFEITVDYGNASNFCFSENDWNSALIKQGWEPFRKFSAKRNFKVTSEKAVLESGNFEKANTVGVQLSGVVTRRGNTYLILTNAIQGYRNTLISEDELNSMVGKKGCLQNLTVDSGSDVDDRPAKAIYDAET